MTEPLPCPFCGCSDVSVGDSVDPISGAELTKTFVWCSGCGAQGPRNYEGDVVWVVGKWNESVWRV